MTQVIPLWREVVPMVRGLFVITDPGRDLDDEDTLVALNRYIRRGILETLGVVANLAPSHMRARLAKGTLQQLGQGEIPVGWGTNCLQSDDDGLAYQFNVGYLAHEHEVVSGTELIVDKLRRAPEKGVILVLISGLTDAANALRSHPDLFLRKVRRVVIMGGVVATRDGMRPELDQHEHLIPDPTAQNHQFDLESTQFLYEELQMNGVALTVVSRFAASAAKVQRSLYDNMAATGHPVGIRIYNAQRRAIEELWNRTWMAGDDPRRAGLPERCDPDWFRKTFLGGQGIDRHQGQVIWDLVCTFQLYDPMTLIAAIPTLRNYFYDAYIIEGIGGVEHHVIGLSSTRHGVARGSELSVYLEDTLVGSLQMSLQEKNVA